MSDRPLASIIINNYNYERWVALAIESALSQTYECCEVIVIDDGSTDDSKEIIRRYDTKVTPIFKSNGGQASAFNAGFRACSGDIVCFLDADDTYLPQTLERVVPLFEESKVSKVHWPLWFVDAAGIRSGAVKEPNLPEGDFREASVRFGPSCCLPSAPTSGNAWARHFLDRVMPVPEDEFRLCADSYLFALAPAFGTVRRLSEPNGCFRRHDANGYQHLSFTRKLELGVLGFERQVFALKQELERRGCIFDQDIWRANAWWPKVQQFVIDLMSVVPLGTTFALADSNELDMGPSIEGRPRLPFLERDGQFWGAPRDDAEAIAELERMRGVGVQMLAVAWPAFWWLEHYSGFDRYLRSRFRCTLQNELLVVFDLSIADLPAFGTSRIK